MAAVTSGAEAAATSKTGGIYGGTCHIYDISAPKSKWDSSYGKIARAEDGSAKCNSLNLIRHSVKLLTNNN